MSGGGSLTDGENPLPRHEASAARNGRLARPRNPEPCDDPRIPMEGETSESYLARTQEEGEGGHGESSYLHRVLDFFRGFNPTEINVRDETKRMANFAVHFSISQSKKFGSSSKTEECLARCILRMHAKHSMVFGGMMLRLNVNRNIDFYQGFVDVSEELFVDDISWSKVVALYAFAARLAQFCAQNDMEDMLVKLTEGLTRFSLEYLSSFIQSQGGWERLCEVFPAENEVEAQLWRGLGVLALGLATCSVVLILRRSSPVS